MRIDRTYVALLRGVNVGGKTVKMDRLRAAFEGMGFGNVRTFIQSGNVLFEAPEDRTAPVLNALIENSLPQALGFEVSVVLLSAEQLEAILAANPFAGRALAEGQRVYITVYKEEPSSQAAGMLLPDTRSADEFVILGRAAYVLCRGGYHETVYSNNFFEKKLKVTATTRNLETMGKLMEMAKDGK